MHSALVRLQNVFGFFTTVAFSVAAVIALSSFITPQSPSANIQLRNVQVVKGRPHYYSYKKEEYAHVKFDLDAGTTLSSLRTATHLLTKPRPHHTLQLEHQASLPLPQSRLPLRTRLGTRLRSHNLGRHPRLLHRALEPTPLRPPRPEIQIQSPPQEIQEGTSRRQSEARLQSQRRRPALPPRRIAPAQSAPEIPNHGY
jgi:hypothetical protein